MHTHTHVMAIYLGWFCKWNKTVYMEPCSLTFRAKIDGSGLMVGLCFSWGTCSLSWTCLRINSPVITSRFTCMALSNAKSYTAAKQQAVFCLHTHTPRSAGKVLFCHVTYVIAVGYSVPVSRRLFLGSVTSWRHSESKISHSVIPTPVTSLCPE